MNRFAIFLFLFGGLSIAAHFPLQTYQIDGAKASVTFTIKNLGIEVNGTLSNPRGTILFDPNDLAGSSIQASVPVKTINTGIDARDESLREEEYFHVDKYPDMQFRSSSITKTANGYQVKGTLTIKGISKSVSIPFSVENQVFTGSFTIDRLDYQVGESSWVMSDEVKVKFSLPVLPA